jgi:hypothetical protein
MDGAAELLLETTKAAPVNLSERGVEEPLAGPITDDLNKEVAETGQSTLPAIKVMPILAPKPIRQALGTTGGACLPCCEFVRQECMLPMLPDHISSCGVVEDG